MTAADQRDDAVAVVRALQKAGHVAYFAGGCVRDELLGDDPKDFDVATSAAPPAVVEVFGKRRTQAVGAAFGVMLVKAGGSQIEVATFRRDGDYGDGRRPDSVVFTSPEEDAKRRDFTINGLFKDPLADDDGIIDYVGGRDDLQRKQINAIGVAEQRFAEDYLRMLRAVRFAARFGFDIGEQTWDALKLYAPKLELISPERIADELRRMLVAPTRGRAWHLLWTSGLLAVVLRTLPEPIGPKPDRTPVFDTLAKRQQSISVALALSATLVQIRRAAGVTLERVLDPAQLYNTVRAVRRALRLSNDETDAMRGMLSIGGLLFGDEPGVATMKRFLAKPWSSEARTLLATLTDEPVITQRREWLMANLAELVQTDYAAEPWVTGDDLIATGLSPGPAFKRALDAAYDAQLEDRVANREQALQLAIDTARDATKP